MKRAFIAIPVAVTPELRTLISLLKEKRAFSGLVSRYKKQEILPVSLDKVIFYESLLFTGGPVYKPIATVSLRAGNETPRFPG